MIVMKFGGTSVQDAASIERVVRLIQERVHLKPVIVISAMGKTTRKLLRAAERAVSRDAAAGLALIDELRLYHTEIVSQLETPATDPTVDAYFDEIRNLITGLSILGELTPRGRDRIASYGELLSTTIVAEALKRAGTPVVWLDARQFMITDENYTQAQLLFEPTNPKIIEQIRPHLQSGRTPVVQGYIGSTSQGATTTLGFEGSDYTAAIIGAALEVEDIQIWTDVNGIMTADPALLPEARTVKTISFAEAKALTHFGAKVLHPSTLFPAHEKAIPVHIFNTNQPQGPNTIITTAALPTRTPVKSIAYKKPVSLVTITPRDLSPTLRFFRTIFETLETTRLFPYITTISESNVALVVDPSERLEQFETELKRQAQVKASHNRAIVCPVGEHLSQVPGIPARVFQALEGTHFNLISQGASVHSLVLVVEMTAVEKTLRRLHDVLFQELDSEIFS